MRVFPPNGIPTTISHDGRHNVPVGKDGTEVPHHVGELLVESHGFTREAHGDQAGRRTDSAPSDCIAVPRGVFAKALRDLGAIVPDEFADDRRIAAFADVAARQSERVEFEVRDAEKRVEKAADERVAAAEARTASEVKAAEERVLASLAEKPDPKKPAKSAS